MYDIDDMTNKYYRWRWTTQEWIECAEEQAQALEVAAAVDPGLRVRMLAEEEEEEEDEDAERWDGMS
jgi:hypothetical protein